MSPVLNQLFRREDARFLGCVGGSCRKTWGSRTMISPGRPSSRREYRPQRDRSCVEGDAGRTPHGVYMCMPRAWSGFDSLYPFDDEAARGGLSQSSASAVDAAWHRPPSIEWTRVSVPVSQRAPDALNMGGTPTKSRRRKPGNEGQRAPNFTATPAAPYARDAHRKKVRPADGVVEQREEETGPSGAASTQNMHWLTLTILILRWVRATWVRHRRAQDDGHGRAGGQHRRRWGLLTRPWRGSLRMARGRALCASGGARGHRQAQEETLRGGHSRAKPSTVNTVLRRFRERGLHALFPDDGDPATVCPAGPRSGGRCQRVVLGGHRPDAHAARRRRRTPAGCPAATVTVSQHKNFGLAQDARSAQHPGHEPAGSPWHQDRAPRDPGTGGLRCRAARRGRPARAL